MKVLKKAIDALRRMDKNPMNWVRGGVRLVRDTPVEVAIMGALGLAVAALVSCRYESNREKTIPLGFSEIGQIEKRYAEENKLVPPVTHYLISTNDAAMKIFESWNKANERAIVGSPYEYFAQELEGIIGPNQKIYSYNLEGLLTILPERAQKALHELQEFANAAIQTSQTNESFDDAWSESHIDHYRTESYTDSETYTGADGESHTRTVTKTRTVYDHTTHSYTYRKQHGENASRKLDAVLASHPALFFKEKMPNVTETGAENEYSMDKSRERLNERMDESELLKTSNTWNLGSTINVNLPIIYSKWDALHDDADLWRQAKGKAHSTTYITHSRFDFGPKEFRVAKNALENGVSFVDSVAEIINGMSYAADKSPELLEDVKEFIAIKLDKKSGNGKKAGREVLETAVKMYEENFKGGFEVDRFRGYMPIIFGLIGIVAGGAAGAVLNHLGDKYRLYRTEKINFFLNKKQI
ncbi:hypothetical protein HY450_03785 [Candidatus Pacearchaeota archaeon]|nr:hypothetical protein [Candidatus Pacearchaeota archaeon]